MGTPHASASAAGGAERGQLDVVVPLDIVVRTAGSPRERESSSTREVGSFCVGGDGVSQGRGRAKPGGAGSARSFDSEARRKQQQQQQLKQQQKMQQQQQSPQRIAAATVPAAAAVKTAVAAVVAVGSMVRLADEPSLTYVHLARREFAPGFGYGEARSRLKGWCEPS